MEDIEDMFKNESVEDLNQRSTRPNKVMRSTKGKRPKNAKAQAPEAAAEDALAANVPDTAVEFVSKANTEGD